MMGIYHSAQIELDRKWTIKQTADYFHVSMGLASENLHLAVCLNRNPALKDCKTRKDALAKIDRRKFPRMES
jgi:hypothetical protein